MKKSFTRSLSLLPERSLMLTVVPVSDYVDLSEKKNDVKVTPKGWEQQKGLFNGPPDPVRTRPCNVELLVKLGISV